MVSNIYTPVQIFFPSDKLLKNVVLDFQEIKTFISFLSKNSDTIPGSDHYSLTFKSMKVSDVVCSI